jgi:hypothetical protein
MTNENKVEIKAVAGVWYVYVNDEPTDPPYPTKAAAREGAIVIAKKQAREMFLALGIDPNAPLPEGTVVSPRFPVPETNLCQASIQFPKTHKRN